VPAAQKKHPVPSATLTADELRALRRLKTPFGIQRFLDDMPYHLATTAYSPRVVLRERTAHCFEGAVFAAAALRALGRPPLLIDLEAHADTDHIICVYQDRGAWGSIGTSNYATCRGRSPIYRNLRELALSYFEGYFNLRRTRSLRRFLKRPIDLARFDKQHWMTSEKGVWYIADAMYNLPHEDLITPAMAKNLPRVDERSFQSGIVGMRKH
jgi:hypothetical protein